MCWQRSLRWLLGSVADMKGCINEQGTANLPQRECHRHQEQKTSPGVRSAVRTHSPWVTVSQELRRTQH